MTHRRVEKLPSDQDGSIDDLTLDTLSKELGCLTPQNFSHQWEIIDETTLMNLESTIEKCHGSDRLIVLLKDLREQADAILINPDPHKHIERIIQTGFDLVHRAEQIL